jgi:hypothetical protein
MNRRRTATALAGVAVMLAAAGCGGTGNAADAGDKADRGTVPPTGAAVATTAAVSPTPSGSSGFGSVKDAGDIPDPCTMLSKAEVTSLTGRAISQVDQDGAKPGDAARFCQWQQDGGQLALFLSRTTESDYGLKVAGAEDVDGVKDPGTGKDVKSFSLAGHLYVLYGTVEVDVYSRGAAADAANLADEKKVAAVVMPKI